MSRKAFYSINNKTNEITIYGYIGNADGETSFEGFVADFEKLATKGDVTIRLNSNGGSLFEAMSIIDKIRNSSVQVTGIVDGVAASAAAVILQACDKRVMQPNARLMIHRPSGVSEGEAEDMESYVTLMKQEEDKIKALLLERTKQPEDVVSTWLIRGTNKWFDAKAALKAGLIDEVLQGEKAAPAATLKGKEVKDVINYYNNFLPKNDNENKDSENIKMKKPILDVFNRMKVAHNLNEDSPEQAFASQVEAALSERDKQIAELQNKLKANTEAVIKGELENAVSTGSITAEQRPAWEKILNADFESGVTALKSLPKRIDINNALEKTPANGEKEPNAKQPRASWTIRDWEKKDPEGLKAMKANNEEAYNKLFNEFYEEEK
ncbi:MAG: Clp protease ClpP [Bacteroidetes bacterium]|nr:Clp protease ClpP [Bacteroidota bacterium]